MTTSRFTPWPTPPAGAPRARTAGGGLRPLIIDVGVPLASYYLLRKAGCAQVTALALSSIGPAAHAVLDLVRTRTLNGLALLMVAVNVLSAAVSFWSGNPRIMLAKDGVVSSSIGFGIVVSVLAGRPLMSAALRPLMAKGDAARDAAFARLEAGSPRFRRLARRFSLVWALACLADCGARVACAWTLPVDTTVWLSTVLVFATLGAAIVVGSAYSVPMEKMVTASAAEAGAAEAGAAEAGAAEAGS
jgi:hypothetical protein